MFTFRSEKTFKLDRKSLLISIVTYIILDWYDNNVIVIIIVSISPSMWRQVQTLFIQLDFVGSSFNVTDDNRPKKLLSMSLGLLLHSWRCVSSDFNLHLSHCDIPTSLLLQWIKLFNVSIPSGSAGYVISFSRAMRH